MKLFWYFQNTSWYGLVRPPGFCTNGMRGLNENNIKTDGKSILRPVQPVAPVAHFDPHLFFLTKRGPKNAKYVKIFDLEIFTYSGPTLSNFSEYTIFTLRRYFFVGQGGGTFGVLVAPAHSSNAGLTVARRIVLL